MNRKILGLIFLAGVLICGFGCGIAFAQFSSFEYAGKRIVGSENIEHKTIEKDLIDSGEIHLDSFLYHDNFSLIADENVPVNKIVFDIDYNPDAIDPRIEGDVYSNDVDLGMQNEGEQQNQNFYMYGYKDDDMKYFFDAKDVFLSDIKQGKIGSYEIEYISEFTVRINPANMDRISY